MAFRHSPFFIFILFLYLSYPNQTISRYFLGSFLRVYRIPVHPIIYYVYYPVIFNLMCIFSLKPMLFLTPGGNYKPTYSEAPVSASVCAFSADLGFFAVAEASFAVAAVFSFTVACLPILSKALSKAGMSVLLAS